MGIIEGLLLLLNVLSQIIAMVLALSGFLLDHAIKLSVTTFATSVDAMKGIEVAWKTFRDLLNMSFIFVLIYNAIMVVFDQGNPKKIIIGIVTAAVLINFSMFFTKLIIDASNIVTIGFYKSIQEAGQQVGVGTQNYTYSFSGAFMNALGINGLFDAQTFINIIASGPMGIQKNLFIVMLGGIVFMLVTIFVFLAMMVMFVVRYIAFLLLLVMSPVAYVTAVIPGLKGTASKYWETLLNQAYFAPVFMICSWVILTVAGGGGFLAGATDSTGQALTLSQVITNPNADSIVLVMRYIVMIGLMIATMTISKEFATKGGLGTKTAVEKGLAWTGGAIFGGAAAIGRNTMGSYASKMAKDEDLQKRADQGDIGARMQLSAAKYVAKGSFDARRSWAGETMQKYTGDMGKGIPFMPDLGKGGYDGAKAAKKKEVEGKLDEIIKRYKDKDDWNKLAEVFNERSEDDKKYIYKTLSPKERVGLDMVMGGPTANAALRDKLNKEEKEKTEEETLKYYAKDKKWGDMVSYFNTKTTDADKQFIYRTLSARDRVAFEKALSPNAATKALLDSSITQEELEKTKDVARKVERQERDEEHINNIKALVAGTPTVNPATGAPYTYDDLLLGTGRMVFSPKNARNLTDAELRDPEVVMRLKAKHLEDIQKNNDDISDVTIQQMKSIIDTGTYPPALAANQNSQRSFINKAANVDFWNI